ncbi:hypothetical protein Taro_053847 [Colocasia esculenta]|uniref:Uncharacterized protein n=1 Tax=Colocasia esculenta TaxID=4460 RepID=A0A843XMB4_COLES|nr:hypothetical protein [Colocasia esculenta]
MTPVSNPDNTTQELPLSLAVMDVRSNCRSTTQRPWPGLARVRHWKMTSWGPVSTTGVRTPNYERATSD